MISQPEDGLAANWHGRVFLNPPYGPETWKWLARLAVHGSGIALVFARTETAGFHAEVWRKAVGLLFLEGRLFFHTPDGKRGKSNAGGPSVLIAYGLSDAAMLANCGIPGHFVQIR